MPYRYRDDLTLADVAFEARGGTLEELFTSAWQATLRVMIENPSKLGLSAIRTFTLEEPSLDLLLHNFLQELIFYKDAEGLLLRVESCRIDGTSRPVKLEASAAGDPIDPKRQRLATDVKAVTFHHFSITRQGPGWQATVVLDV